jgi:hypothetical protein
MWPISRAMSAERWDVHKKHRPPQAEPLDDGESSRTGSNDIDTDTEEEILRRIGLRRRCAGTHHASHANIVLGSRCVAALHELISVGLFSCIASVIM